MNKKKFILLYLATFVVSSLLVLLCIPESNAYWMHDASIDVTHGWLFRNCCYLFLPPLLLVAITATINESYNQYIWIQYTFAFLSVVTLLLCLHGPVGNNDGYVYSFTGFWVLLFYPFKLISLFCLAGLIFKTFRNPEKSK